MALFSLVGAAWPVATKAAHFEATFYRAALHVTAIYY